MRTKRIKHTDALANAISSAKTLALGYDQSTILVEMLVVCLLKGDFGARRILQACGVDADDVISSFENRFIHGSSSISPAEIRPTKAMLAIFDAAEKEAQDRNDDVLTTAHVLLATLATDHAMVCRKIFTEEGVLISNARKHMEDLRRNYVHADAVVARSGVIDPREIPALSKYSVNLTQMAIEGNLDPICDRDKEIEQILHVLSRRGKNNCALVGDAGVGKTAIVEGLAIAFAEGRVPEHMLGKSIFAINVSSLVAGAKYRGDFEERMRQLLDDARKFRDAIVLYFDEMHIIASAGRSEGAVDASSILKPALARGEIQAIGSTTEDEYRRYIEQDAALDRRFKPVKVSEPSEDAAVRMLMCVAPKYEAHHNVAINEKVIRKIVRLTSRYIGDRRLPDKAIDTMDDAMVHALRDNRSEVTVDDVFTVITDLVGYSIDHSFETSGLRNLKERLSKRVIGQETAVELIAGALRRAKTDIRNPQRPMASFLFVGPSSVGKNSLAEAIAHEMFAGEISLLTIDMSEFQEQSSVSKFLGSGPGYVGYDEGGRLVNAMRKNPHVVVVFDEIEKAHPDVSQLLLQVLEKGKLTDSRGRVARFNNAVIILTSNLGAKDANRHLGLVQKERAGHEKFMDAVKQFFAPELINRLDDVVVFNALTLDNLRQIVLLKLKEVQTWLEPKEYLIEFDETVIDYLTSFISEGQHARSLDRIIQINLSNRLSDMMINEEIAIQKSYLLIARDGELTALERDLEPLATTTDVETINL